MKISIEANTDDEAVILEKLLFSPMNEPFDFELLAKDVILVGASSAVPSIDGEACKYIAKLETL